MIKLFHGDCLDVLPTLEANSVDSIVTDPPYGLSFMGKDWDHGVPGVPFWEAALRVAKPGAHLLAFGGRRTEHRLACAIEDAGWEIRDKVAWCYAMGFPKSYNVSKVLTNLIPSSLRCACAHHLTYTGLSSQVDCLSDCGSHDALLRMAQDSDPASAPSQGDALEHSHGDHNEDDLDTRQVHSPDHSPIVPLSIGDCVLLLGHLSTGSQSEHSRLSDMLESMLRAGLLESRRMAFRILGIDDLASDSVLALPYSDAPDSSISRIYHKCQECQGYLAVTGYGTALKPAIEEIIMARKPLEGTVAANVLKWGAGGINIDACRVPSGDGHKASCSNDGNTREHIGAQQNRILSKSRQEAGLPQHGRHTDPAPNAHEYERMRKQPQGFQVDYRPYSRCGDVPAHPSPEGDQASALQQVDGLVPPCHCATELNSRACLSTCSYCTTPHVDSQINTGRWPSNLVHDGSDEVVALFPVTGPARARRLNGNELKPPRAAYGDYRKRTEGGVDDNGGSASRFFQACPWSDDDRRLYARCALCGLPDNARHGIMTAEDMPCSSNASSAEKTLHQETTITNSGFVVTPVQQSGQHSSEDRPEQSTRNAQSAGSCFGPSPATTGDIALTSADSKQLESLVRNVKCAGNLCDLCATAIAQSIVLMKRGQSPASLHGLASISEHKKQILTQCLVSFVALLGNTDTTPTMDNLNLFFGYVRDAIANYTPTHEKRQVETQPPTRLQYVSKASKRDRDEGLEEFEERRRGAMQGCVDDGEFLTGSGNPRRPIGRNTHPTVKPTALMRYLVRLVTPPGGVVLDPFMGSGSTGKAARLEGRDFIGIEMDVDYHAIAEARIAWAEAQVAEAEPVQLSLGVE